MGKKRAQIFSMDFLISVAVFTIVLGAVLNMYEFNQRRHNLQNELSSNEADVIAEAIVSSLPAPTPSPPHSCIKYKETDTLSQCSCEKNTFYATRLVAKADQSGWDVVKVKVCG
ncbi:hypothetical protein HY991_02130 [Candidatus Micrarchaeota archaeon]|nr:hypothetical protein [Candidatus Micrarchaeota archaeon]